MNTGQRKIRHFALTLFLLVLGPAPASAEDALNVDFHLPPTTYYPYSPVLAHSIFYRETGDPAAPTLVLLHGYPSALPEPLTVATRAAIAAWQNGHAVSRGLSGS